MYRTQCDDIILNIFFTLQCELFTQVAMFQIMPALCPHSQGEGQGGGWGGVGVLNQMWKGLDRGSGGSKNYQICADILYG